MWRDDEWDGVCLLIEEGWPGTFDAPAAQAFRALLDDAAPRDVVGALKRLLYAGSKFRPSAAELLSEMRSDPSKPSFPEAYQLIYGPKGVLRAEPPRTDGPLIYSSEAERRALFNDAARERASELHPLVAAFVHRYGIDRLRALQVDDPTWGVKVQGDLENAWDKHCEITDGRDVAALASGGTNGELRKLDPLAALGLERPKELEA